MRTRTFRAPDSLWVDVKARAKADKVVVPEIIRRALYDYLEAPRHNYRSVLWTPRPQHAFQANEGAGGEPVFSERSEQEVAGSAFIGPVMRVGCACGARAWFTPTAWALTAALNLSECEHTITDQEIT